jgi:hypothetical protein
MPEITRVELRPHPIWIEFRIAEALTEAEALSAVRLRYPGVHFYVLSVEELQRFGEWLVHACCSPDDASDILDGSRS